MPCMAMLLDQELPRFAMDNPYALKKIYLEENMDLKSFAEQNKHTQNTKPQSDDNGSHTNTAHNMNEADVRRAIKHFGGMSNDQLMRELSKHISAKKRAGKEVEIQNILERIKPMLNDEQRKRLDEIMRSFA